jgi:pyridoxal phosphate enzyme (YggS family)
MSIKNNISLFKRDIESSNCKLVAVSKTHPTEKILEAYGADQRIFGENKVQEMVAKWEVLPKDIEWHLIGHLQTNKVKYIAPFVSLIHSVDSQKLLEEINKQARKVNRKINCLLQIHIAKEETKFGFNEQELISLLDGEIFSSLDSITLKGLMGMATLTEDKNQIRNEFRYLKHLFDQVKTRMPLAKELNELSMGMSSDYKIAMEEGSTMVRIGTAIFGDRDYSTITN